MEGFLLDLRYTIRSLFRNPGFTAAAVLTLTLGIGATTAIFSLVNGILIVPLPYRQPDRLVTVSHLYRARNNLRAQVSPALFRDLTARTDILTGSAVERAFALNLTSRDAEPERVQVSQVSATYFSVLGVAPATGRILRTEDAEGNDHVVVVSWNFWQRRFGNVPVVSGPKVMLDNEAYEIVGVMPPHFKDFYWPRTELFMPLVLRPIDYGDDRRGNEYLSFIGRLRAGISIGRAQAELHTMAARLRIHYPDQYSSDWDIETTALSDDATRSVRGGLLLLLGAVAFVLLITCANVANLFLARTLTRSRELAIRVATGASPWRVMRHLLTESLVLAVGAGGLGLLLTVWGVPALSSWFSSRVAATESVHVDTRVLGFALVVSLLTAVLCGLLPALQMTRTNLHETLKEGGRATGHRATLGLRRGLVVGTVALALVLLVGAGLLLRSFARLIRVDPGFRPDHLLTFDVSLPLNGSLPPDMFTRIAAALQATPGVVTAGGTTVLPFSDDSSPKSFPSTRTFNTEGSQPAATSAPPWGEFRFVTSGYFRTLRIPLLAGRQFTASDRAGAPLVCIVDQELARRYWPNADPIGKRITIGDPADPSTRWIPVVGVVGHMLQERLDGENRVQIYFHEAQLSTRLLAFAVRTAGSPLAAVPAVRDAVHSVAPDLSLAHIDTMEHLIARSTSGLRFAMLLLCGFAVLAISLASIGLYGVTSYMVTQRSRELGVRLVLGAETREVLRLVISEGLRLAFAGLALGLAAAFALTRVMKHVVFDVSVTDPLTFLTIALLLLAVALVASYLPALRATKVNPIEVLRAE